MKDIFKFLKEHNETSELENFVENITDAELEEVSQEFLDETGGFEEGGRSGGSYAVSTAYAAGRKAGGLGMPKDKTDKDKVRAGRAARDAEFKARRDAARAPAKVLQSSVSETKKNKLEPRSKNSEPYENTGIDEKAPKIDMARNKKPVSQMTPKEKAAADARRKEYNAYQKSKREEGVIDEKKNSQSNYDLYHSSFSGAMQHAYKHAKDAHGITVHSSEIDDKVASGPRKPVNGKTNTYRLKGDKGNIQVQVYNKGGSKPFELNMYKESVVEDVEMIIESVSPKQIAMLKKQYSDMPDRLPLDQAQKMSKMVAKFDKEALMKVAKADIKWISSVAKTNLISKHGATAKDFKEDMSVHGAPSHSADKKPQNYRKPDGKMGVKMVPMDPQTTRKESVEIDEATDFKSTFDDLKKGDIVKIKYGSTISKQQEGTFKVTFKSIVGKAKVGKITLVKQGEGAAKVKHYLYDRNGKVSMAMGDMGASMTSLVKESILEDYFPEKLSVDQGLGAWIRDFSKSDAPSLKGKSAGKRKSMAYVAFKSAQEK